MLGAQPLIKFEPDRHRLNDIGIKAKKPFVQISFLTSSKITSELFTIRYLSPSASRSAQQKVVRLDLELFLKHFIVNGKGVYIESWCCKLIYSKILVLKSLQVSLGADDGGGRR